MLETIYENFTEALSDFFRSLTEKVIELLANIVNFLPDSPFNSINNSDINSYLGGLNWVFPISQIVSILEAWLVVIAVYYTYQLILRWTKLIK